MRASRLRSAVAGVVVMAAAILAAGCTGHHPAGVAGTVSRQQVRRLASDIVLERVTSRPRVSRHRVPRSTAGARRVWPLCLGRAPIRRAVTACSAGR